MHVRTLPFTPIAEENDQHRQYIIVNANFQKVFAALETYLQDARFNICHCQRCISDIAALALNYLPPHYYVDRGRDGNIGSPSVMVQSAVIEAIETVGKNPRHQK